MKNKTEDLKDLVAAARAAHSDPLADDFWKEVADQVEADNRMDAGLVKERPLTEG